MNSEFTEDDLIKILENRGVGLEELTEAAFELYEGNDFEEGDKDQFKDLIGKYAADENVYSLMLSALLMEESERVKYQSDPSFLIADELIGTNIAEYIAGKRAHFNFIRYDNNKPGVISELGPFLDDVVAGLIAGCMTRLYEEDRNC